MARPAIDPEIVSAIKSRIEQGLYVGLIIGILDSDGEHYYSYGKKSLTSLDAPDNDTVFTLGSISKTFVATVLADMVAKGEIAYEQPLKNHVSEGTHVPVRGELPITIWNLATHTSGLSRKPPGVSDMVLWDGYNNYPREQAYLALGRSALAFDTGQDISYSSFGYGLLVDVLTRKTGESWETLLSERVTGPLSLTRTSSMLSPRLNENLAQGYCYLTPTSADVRMVINENGSVKSTAADMLTYLRANMGMLDSPLIPTLQSTHTVQFEVGPVPETQQALGWWIRGDYILHTGMTDGYRSMVAFNKAQGRAVVVLSNSSAYMQDIGMRLIEPGHKLWKPKPALSIAIMQAVEQEGIRKTTDRFLNLSKRERNQYWVNMEGLIDNAIYYIRQGDTDRGIGLLRIADSYSPKDASVHYALGYALQEIGNKERAAYHFAKSEEYDQT